MGRQERKASIISIVIIVLFMVSVAVVQNMKAFQALKDEPKMNLLADISSNVTAPKPSPTQTASAQATTPTTTKATSAATGTVAVATSSGSVAVPPPSTTTAKAPAPVVPAAAPSSTPAVVATTSPTPTSSPFPSPKPKSAPPPAPAVVTRSLPYSVGTFGNKFVNGDGWTGALGTVFQKSGLMTVEANAATTVGQALLGGDANWSGYTFQAQVDWIKGESFGLIADYVDPKNYLLCNFVEPTPGTIHMTFQKYVNGTATTLATGDVNNYEQMGGDGLNVAIEVTGNDAVCSFNNHQIEAFGAMDTGGASSSLQGGIGFSTWDPRFNNSEIVVHTVGVMNGAYDFGSSPS